MNDTIKLKKDGTEFDANLICYFQNKTNSKKYVFYTKAEEDSANSPTIKIHVALISQPDIALNSPISDEEWASLKEIMGNVLKSAPNPNIGYLKTNNTIEIADEKVIGMPSSYDYVAKHKTVYNNEAVEDTTPTVAEAPINADTPNANVESPATGPIIPEVPGSTPAAPEAPTGPIETPGFGGAMESVIAPTNVSDVNPIQSLISDQPGEAQSPEDKPLPTVPETPVAPEAPMNENIQIPPIPEASVENAQQIVPNTPEVPEVAPVEAPVEESTAPIPIVTKDEINKKFDDIIGEISELRDEALRLVDTSKEANSVNEEVKTNTPPADVPITPITPETPAANAGDAPATDEGTNWFDMPN